MVEPNHVPGALVRIPEGRYRNWHRRGKMARRGVSEHNRSGEHEH